MTKFPQLCTPAMVYFGIAMLSLVIALFKKFEIFSILIKAFFICLWTYILNFLCLKGYTTISWILVILPFVMMLGVVAVFFEMLKKNTSTTMQPQQIYPPPQQQQQPPQQY